MCGRGGFGCGLLYDFGVGSLCGWGGDLSVWGVDWLCCGWGWKCCFLVGVVYGGFGVFNIFFGCGFKFVWSGGIGVWGKVLVCVVFGFGVYRCFVVFRNWVEFVSWK